MTKPGEKRAAVLGWPVSHSLSPRLHGYWLKQYAISGSYEAIAVPPEELATTLRSLVDRRYAGVNLTLPHKEKALSLVDEADMQARRIGAVNTIIMKEGKLVGANTDAYGFMANLHAAAAGVQPGKAVVLGAGGAARAICVGLLDAGWNVTIVNRTPEKAHALRDFLAHERIAIASWQEKERAMQDAALLVNTTSLGMKGQPPLVQALEDLPEEAFVYDIVYSPLITPLLAAARQRGNRVITGLGMLLYQAQPAFEGFFGVRPEVTDALRAHVEEGLS